MYEAWEVREAQFASVVDRNEALKHQNDTMRRMLHDYRNDFTEESRLRQHHRVILADMKGAGRYDSGMPRLFPNT